MGRWSDLPVDLLLLLEDHLVLYSDKLRIRAVCLLWHLQLPKMPNRKFPWLLQKVDTNIHLYNPVDKKVLNLDSPSLLNGKIFKGSGHGWVVTLEDVYDRENSNRIYLVNPITSARIELPSRNMFPDVVTYQPDRVNEEYFVFEGNEEDNQQFEYNSFQMMTDELTHKFVMSCDPSRSNDEECLVAVIYGLHSCLATCTLNDTRWTPLPIQISSFEDIIFYRGKLLLGLIWNEKNYQVLAFENISGFQSYPRITLIADHIPDPSNTITFDSKYSETTTEEYLVESSDGSCLMIVERVIGTIIENEDVEIPETLNFKVYRVDPVNRTSVRLNSIGDDILIVGLNSSISVSSDNSVGYKRNHIYFTDSECSYYRRDGRLENNEIGVFSLDDGTLQPLSGPKFLWPPPIWVNLS